MSNIIALRQAPDRLVNIEGDHTSTTSLIVSEAFGKLHAHVLRAIRGMECSEEFRRSNFGSAPYIDEQGKPRVMYSITRDGAMMLIMGFTGSKAAGMREAFIAEFGRMESSLKARSDQRALKAEAESRRALRELAAARRQIIVYARREIRALKAQLPKTAPAPQYDPLQFELALADVTPGMEG
ncbi:hypothetical protein THICB3320746 [Thiomonas sp. CB3]|nr:hypothetical protein THICB3320746 [Thiomonas sp. CB3]